MIKSLTNILEGRIKVLDLRIEYPYALGILENVISNKRTLHGHIYIGFSFHPIKQLTPDELMRIFEEGFRITDKRKFEGRFRVYSTPDKRSRKHYLNVLSTNTDQPVISSRRFNEGLIVY